VTRLEHFAASVARVWQTDRQTDASTIAVYVLSTTRYFSILSIFVFVNGN